MTTYSTSFFAGTHTGGLVQVFTPATGHVYVLRQITAYEAAAAGDAAEVSTGVPGSTIPIWHQESSSTVLQSLSWEGRVVLPPGSGLFVATAGAAWYFTLSGYDLSP